MNTTPRRLRQLLQDEELLMLPGAFDAMTAKLIALAGFPALFVTGAGVSLSLLAQPDLETVSYLELRNRTEEILAASGLPALVDVDTGGNPLNLIRLVRDFERIGVAAIQVEDQASPKRCGHAQGRKVVEPEDMVLRIRAVADNRSGSDGLVLVARTDARTSLGPDEAIRRANLYLEAGADLIFVESPESEAEVHLPRGRRPYPLQQRGRRPLPLPQPAAARRRRREGGHLSQHPDPYHGAGGPTPAQGAEGQRHHRSPVAGDAHPQGAVALVRQRAVAGAGEKVSPLSSLSE